MTSGPRWPAPLRGRCTVAVAHAETRGDPGAEVAAHVGPGADHALLHRASVATAATSGARGGSGDRRPGGRDGVPEGAEGVYPLAGRIARALVAREPVQRMAVVGHLCLSIGPRRGSNHRGTRPGAGRRLAGCPQRWPCAGAGAKAGALGPRVFPEQVQRVALGIDEDLAEGADVGGTDRRRTSRRGSGRRCRCGGATVAAAARGDAERNECCRRDPDEDCDVSVARHEAPLLAGDWRAVERLCRPCWRAAQALIKARTSSANCCGYWLRKPCPASG